LRPTGILKFDPVVDVVVTVMVSVCAISLPSGVTPPAVMIPFRSNTCTTNLTVPPAVVANALTVAESRVIGCVAFIPNPFEKLPPGAVEYPTAVPADANAEIGGPPTTGVLN
jgi:hypothetical protein